MLFKLGIDEKNLHKMNVPYWCELFVRKTIEAYVSGIRV
jgi:hypothetical protein